MDSRHAICALLMSLGLLSLAGASSAAGELSLRGEWTELPPPSRSDQVLVYDPVRDRVLVLGGRTGESESRIWVLTLGPNGQWVHVETVGDPPPGAVHHTAIYDPIRDRVLVFGGLVADPAGGLRNTGDLWELALEPELRWTRLEPAGLHPAPRHEHSAIYDSARRRMIVFGGIASEPTDEVWALSLEGEERWSPQETTNPPPPTAGHGAAYDPQQDRMILLRDTQVWSLSLASGSWEHLPVEYPQESFYGPILSCIYDPVGNRALVVVQGYSGRVAMLDLGPNGGWSTRFTGRFKAPAAYDSRRHRLIVHDNRALGFPLDAWKAEAIPPADAGPLPRHGGHVLVHDGPGNRLLVYGGTFNAGIDESATWDTRTYSLSTGMWTVEDRGPYPPRQGASIVPTSLANRYVLFSGTGVYDPPPDKGDTWQLSMNGTPGWLAQPTSGEAPPARAGHSAIYDPARNRMIVWGGYRHSIPDNSFEIVSGDPWVLSLSGFGTWSRLAIEGESLPPRYHAGAVYHPWRDAMVIFGGRTSSFTGTNEVWALEFVRRAQWVRIDPAGEPPEPAGYQSPPFSYSRFVTAFDEETGLILVYGGGSRLWTLELDPDPAWQEIEVSGTNPEQSACGVFDLGSRTLYSHSSGVHALRLITRLEVEVRLRAGSHDPQLPGAWRGVLPVAILSTPTFDALRVDPASLRIDGVPIADFGPRERLSARDANHDGLKDLGFHVDGSRFEPNHPRITVHLEGRTFDGLEIHGTININQVPRFEPQDALQSAHRLAIDRAEPLSGNRGVIVTLGAGGPGALNAEIFDIQGRAVHQQSLPDTGASTFTLRTPVRLASGVYFLRVRRAREIATRRIVVL